MTDIATIDQPAASGIELPVSVRLTDGVRDLVLSPESHQELHLRMLHGRTRGLVEIAAGRRDDDGELHIHTRRRADHFLPGGGTGDPVWLERLLALVAGHVAAGEDVFVGPATHSCPSANKEDIHWSSWAWLDIDGGEHLGRLDALEQRKPAAARVWSGGSGGEHAYFPLAKPIPARTLKVGNRNVVNPIEVTESTPRGGTRPVGYRDTSTGELIEGVRAEHWIEKANLRLIHSLGIKVNEDGQRVYVADIRCRNRSRLLRLAGTVHSGSGQYARLSYLDLRLPAYDPHVLLGDLADPASQRPRRRRGLRRFAADPLMQIPCDVYFWRLAGIELPAKGNISCPSPSHPDVKPSCSVTDYVWFCHGCEAQGTIIDLASLLDGGPTGDVLAASTEDFKRAKRLAREGMGVL
jgi:hypothetical protein